MDSKSPCVGQDAIWGMTREVEDERRNFVNSWHNLACRTGVSSWRNLACMLVWFDGHSKGELIAAIHDACFVPEWRLRGGSLCIGPVVLNVSNVYRSRHVMAHQDRICESHM